MKLKKVISLCHQRKTFRLFDKISENGEIVQWMGDGCAAYPLNGLPILDEETLCAVFDISEKQLKNTSIRRLTMPDVLNIGDWTWVKVSEIDERGRVNLSRKDAIKEREAAGLPVDRK